MFQKDLNRVLELNPRHHNAHILMASLFMISSDWEQSAFHFESAFSLVPSCMDEKLLYQHGCVLSLGLRCQSSGGGVNVVGILVHSPRLPASPYSPPWAHVLTFRSGLSS